MNTEHPFSGKYCIVRCAAAGVHAGTIVSVDGDQVILSNARRLWSWTANAGVALSGLARYGLEAGRIDTVVPEHCIRGWCELIPCTDTAQASIENVQ